MSVESLKRPHLVFVEKTDKRKPSDSWEKDKKGEQCCGGWQHLDFGPGQHVARIATDSGLLVWTTEQIIVCTCYHDQAPVMHSGGNLGPNQASTWHGKGWKKPNRLPGALQRKRKHCATMGQITGGFVLNFLNEFEGVPRYPGHLWITETADTGDTFA